MLKKSGNSWTIRNCFKNAQTTENDHTQAHFVTNLFISLLLFRIEDKLVAPLVYSSMGQVATIGFRNNFLATSSSS